MFSRKWDNILSFLRKVREVSFNEYVFPITEEEGLIIYSLTLLFSSRFKNLKIFEAGSGIGYSTLWFLLALKENNGGIVYAVDKSKKKLEKLISNARELGLEKFLKTFVGDAVRVAEEIGDCFHIAFIDIEKHRYIELFKVIEDRITRGGVVLAHNAWMVSSYIKWLKNKSIWKTIIIPSSEGIVLSIKQ